LPAPTQEQVISLAPDDGAAKAGRDLATARKWQNLGFNEAAVWGECQGSGATPYQTRVDLSDYVAKCTCPSRKFPCKHGLGLLLLMVKEESAFKQGESPSWVGEWLQSRKKRVEKKAKDPDAPVKPPDPVAQAKRAAGRTDNIKSGITDLDRWLQDLVRQGFASIQNETYNFWEAQAKRLVDAQAPGLARMVRQCAGTASLGEGWQEKLLKQVSQIHLLVEAYSRIDQLSAETQADIRTAIGINTAQDDVLARDGVSDTWCVVAQKVEAEEKLRSQRTWLRGNNTGRVALVLSFAYGTAPLDASLLAGHEVDAELAFYPSAYPLRALLKKKQQEETKFVKKIIGYETFVDALTAYADGLADNPWIERFPMPLSGVVPTLLDDQRVCLVDRENNLIPLSVSSMATGWQLMAGSGGNQISVFGEWNGRRLTPLSLYADDKFCRL
jgi:hypothetical protein